MKKKNDQLDFNFSRPIDFQRNLSLNFVDQILFVIDNEYKNVKKTFFFVSSFGGKNKKT